MHETFRQWILKVLNDHRGVMAIALRQRAKFEGWLKFELAAHAEMSGARNVEVEAPLPGRGRSDLSFNWGNVRYDVELKTSNMNWRMPGVMNRTRPVSKNRSGIIADARKATAPDRQPLVAFVVFPVPCGDEKWRRYFQRISTELELSLTHDVHTSQITLPISEQHNADVVVCCFPVITELGSGSVGNS